MLDFAQLRTAESARQQQQQARNALTGNLYAEALAGIDAFLRHSDKAALRAALAKLQQSLGRDSRQAEPYAVLGFVFYGLGKFQLASEYYRQASRLDPGLPLVKRLQTVLSGPAAGPEINYDELYDQVQAQIQTQLPRLLAEPGLKPDLSPGLPGEIAGRIRQLTAWRGELEARLAELDRELDVSELKLGLGPLEARLSELDRLARLVQRFGAIDAAIARACELARQELGRPAQPDQQARETRFEYLLDDCNRIADQIDALEEQGQDITPLMSGYQRMLALVEQVQESLDEPH